MVVRPLDCLARSALPEHRGVQQVRNPITRQHDLYSTSYHRVIARASVVKPQSTARASYLQPNTVPSPSWPARLIRSNVSTARCGSGFRGRCAPRYRSSRSSAITLVLSDISFVTRTSPKVQRYLDSTTG